MKKSLSIIVLCLFASASVFATGVNADQPGGTTGQATRAVDPIMARQLDKLMTADPKADPTLSKREVKQRLSVKQKVQRQLAKLKAKIAEVNRPVEDIADLLRTIGIICIIVGAVLLILGLILSGGVYYGSGGGLLVLGIILYLVAVYAL
jgi:hypothetical protein